MLRIVGARPALSWLEPPVPTGRLTVDDVLCANDFPAATDLWARDVWSARAPHHAAVRGWLVQALSPASRA